MVKNVKAAPTAKMNFLTCAPFASSSVVTRLLWKSALHSRVSTSLLYSASGRSLLRSWRRRISPGVSVACRFDVTSGGLFSGCRSS